MPYGQNADFGISFQNSWDSVGSVNSARFLPILNESVGKNIPELVSESMRSIFEEGDSYEGPHANDGDFEVECQPANLAVMLKAAFGSLSTVTSGSLKTHTFTPSTSDWDDTSALKPFTIYKYLETGSAMQFYNMNASGLEIMISNGELLKAKLSVVGGGFQQISNTSATYPSGRKIWTWDSTSLSIAGTANADIENMTLKLNNAVEAVHTLNASKLPSGTKVTGFRTLEIEGTIKFIDQDEYQSFLNSDERQLKVHCQGTSAVQSGYYESITIDVPKMRYSEFKPQATGPGEITVGFTAKGKYSVESANLLKITMQTSETL